jgi:Type ISP C-terminal specificity domain
MRQSLMQTFQSIWIENMHGNRVITEYAPDGRTSETVFAMAGFSPGIQQGITISTLVRTGGHEGCTVRYRNDLNQARSEERRQGLLASLDEHDLATRYENATPSRANRFSFRPRLVREEYASWPDLRGLAHDEPFSGLSEKRKGALIHFERQPLEARMRRYLDPDLSFTTVKASRDGPVEDAARFDSRVARTRIVAREPFNPAQIVRYAMHPMDLRWAYHTNVRPVWNEPRPEFAAQVRDRNLFIVSRMAGRRPDEGLPVVATRALANHHLLDPNAHAIPTRVFTAATATTDLFGSGTPASRANLSANARAWLAEIGWPDPDADAEAGLAPWLHALAICCAPAWLTTDRAAIVAGWPRLPLPDNVNLLRSSAALGTQIAALLDPDEPVAGKTSGRINAPFTILGSITRSGGGQLGAGDLAITAGWGNGGNGRPVMPAQGRSIERDSYDEVEKAAITSAAQARGETVDAIVARLGPPIDVYLNEVAYWRAVPRSVWDLTVGGYQVFKKWLSYREHTVLGRALTTSEVREATNIVRRLTALVLMGPDLDANYWAVCEASYSWTQAREPEAEPDTSNVQADAAE